MRKKWLAAVLCLCLVAGLLPCTALAADGESASPWKVATKETDITADNAVNYDGYGSLKKFNGDDDTQIALIDSSGNFRFPYQSDIYEDQHGLNFYVSDGIVSLTTETLYIYDVYSTPTPKYFDLNGKIAIDLEERVEQIDWQKITTQYFGNPMMDGYTVIMDFVTHSGGHGSSSGAENARIIDKTGKVTYKLPDGYLCLGQYGAPEEHYLGLCSEGLFAFYEREEPDYSIVREGYMDPYGKTVIEFKECPYDTLFPFHQGLAAVQNKEGKYGFIDKNGTEVIPCQYQDFYYEGGLIAVQEGDKWGFIDSTGNEVIPFKYDEAFPGPEGLLSVARNGKYGLIDSADNVVVDFVYDDISTCNKGVAYAVKDGKVSIITCEGPGLSDRGIYTISFDTMVTSITVPSQKTGTNGKLVSLPAPEREGYSLDGWFTAQEDGVKISKDYVFNRDTTVYARWTRSGQEQPVNPDDPNKPVNPDKPNNPDNNGSSSNGGGGGGSSKPSIRPGANTNKPTTPVTPNTPSGSVSSFSDVRSSDWHAAAVNYVVSRGIMNGTGNGAFSPNATTTRGMVMTMLARLSGVSTDGGAVWYERGMQWAKEQGISDGSDPNGAVSREQLVSMLYRSMNSPAVSSSLAGFPDASNVSSWAADAMAWAVDNGLIQGDNKGALNPGGSATRAEVATILMRYCEKFGK